MTKPVRHAYTPSIQELRALVECAQLGSASRAASALNLTQSAVSRSIRSLEDKLGVQMFRRIRQRLILSDSGRAMVREARGILDHLDTSSRMVMAFGGGRNVLRLAVLPTFAATWLIPRLYDFTHHNPDVSIDLAAALHPIDFDDSPFDAALQRAEMARPGTRVSPLVQETLIAVAAPGLVGPELPLSPADMFRFPLIQLATRHELWSDWFVHLGVGRMEQLPGPRFEHFEMVIAAAQAGLGLAILPDTLAEQAIKSGTLCKISSAGMKGRSPYSLIQPDNKEPRQALSAFSQWLQSIAMETAVTLPEKYR